MKKKTAEDPSGPRQQTVDVKKSRSKTEKQALQELVIFQQRLIDALPLPIFYMDSEGRYLGSNSSFEKFFGQKREQTNGKSIYELFPKEIADLYHEKNLALLQNPGIQIYETTVKDGDGAVHQVIFHKATFPNMDGSVGGLIGGILDITDRKQAEEKLFNSEARLHTLLQTIPDLIWLKDKDGVYLSCNTMFERFFGAGEADIVGKTDYDFVDRELADAFRENDKNAMEAGKPTRNEEWITFADDGRRAFLETIKMPMSDAQGKQIGVLGIGRDITERKRAEAALSKSEEKFRKAFNTSTDAVNISRLADGMFSSINPGFTKITGYTEEEIIGKAAIELNIWGNSADRQKLQAGLKKDGEVTNLEAAFRTKGGDIRYGLLSASIIDFDGVPHIISIFRDITLRKLAEEALKESENKYRLLADNADDVIFVLDMNLHYTYISPSVKILRGYEPEEVLQESSMRTLTPSSWDLAMRTVSEVMALEKSGHGEIPISRTLQLEMTRKDGSTVWTEVNLSLIRDKNQQPVSILGVTRDITERRRTEESLNQAKEKAEVANRAKSDFLANMSHEIRTPLNAILGMADLLAETSLSKDQEKYVQILHGAGENLLILINNILDLSKVEAGQIKLEAIPFNLGNLIEKTGEILGMRAGDKGLDLVCHIRPDLPLELVGDPLRLWQILTNLIGNAIKFTEKGDIALTVKATAPIDPAAKEVVMVFSVADTGIGLSRDEELHIFEKFTQADTSTSRKYGGTGLGLAITKHLVELMGGTLSVRSEPGKGSVFSFTVSLAIQDPSQPREETLSPPDLQNIRILVVDDNATNRMIVREFLVPCGAKVAEAAGGEEALALLHRTAEAGKPFDMVILDQQMPGMDGFETARYIKAQPSLRGMILVLLTSLQRKDDMERASEIGFVGVLYKPVKRTELREAVAKALGILEPRGAQESIPATIPVSLPERPLRILFAEDNEDNRLLIRLYLKNTPYDMQEAVNGQIAVNKFINDGPFDLVLMDIQMPVMDGYTATRAIRSWELEQDRKRTPIVALTAYALKEDIQKSLDAGCDAHLTKPLKKAVLLEAISRYAAENDIRK